MRNDWFQMVETNLSDEERSNTYDSDDDAAQLRTVSQEEEEQQGVELVEQNQHNTRSKKGPAASPLATKHGTQTHKLKTKDNAEKHGTKTHTLKTNDSVEKHGTTTHTLKTNDSVEKHGTKTHTLKTNDNAEKHGAVPRPAAFSFHCFCHFRLRGCPISFRNGGRIGKRTSI